MDVSPRSTTPCPARPRTCCVSGSPAATGSRPCGRNSDAYLLAFLGCASAGLVHVPINYALTGGELTYLLRALRRPGRPRRRGAARLRRGGPRRHRPRAGAAPPRRRRRGAATAGARATCPRSTSRRADTDLVQLLYTSGTTSQPKGAMMTHRALVHEYVSSIVALDLREDDDAAALACRSTTRPQMHVFLLPYLAVGATNHLMTRPDVADDPRAVEADRHRLALPRARPCGCRCRTTRPSTRRDLTSLRKAYYGASIMPVPVLRPAAAAAARSSASTTASGSREIGPLATVLRPRGARRAARGSAGGRCSSSRPGSSTPRATTSPAGDAGRAALPLAAAVHRLLGQAEATARGLPRRLVPLRRPRDAATRTATSPSSTASRTSSTPAASWSPRARSRTRSTRTPPSPRSPSSRLPDERWIEAVTAVVVLRAGQTVTEAELIDARPRRRSRRFKAAQARSTSSTSCPATRAASCSSGCSATRSRKAASRVSGR